MLVCSLIPVIEPAQEVEDNDKTNPYCIGNTQRKTITLQLWFKDHKSAKDHITRFESAKIGRKHCCQVDQVNMNYIIEKRNPADGLNFFCKP